MAIVYCIIDCPVSRYTAIGTSREQVIDYKAFRRQDLIKVLVTFIDLVKGRIIITTNLRVVNMPFIWKTYLYLIYIILLSYYI